MKRRNLLAGLFGAVLPAVAATTGEPSAIRGMGRNALQLAGLRLVRRAIRDGLDLERAIWWVDMDFAIQAGLARPQATTGDFAGHFCGIETRISIWNPGYGPAALLLPVEARSECYGRVMASGNLELYPFAPEVWK